LVIPGGPVVGDCPDVYSLQLCASACILLPANAGIFAAYVFYFLRSLLLYVFVTAGLRVLDDVFTAVWHPTVDGSGPIIVNSIPSAAGFFVVLQQPALNDFETSFFRELRQKCDSVPA
jgi:hypothetical protein